MESLNKKALFIAAIFAIITAFLIYSYLNKATPVAITATKTLDVYVAAKTMPAKYKITESDVKIIKVAEQDRSIKAVLAKKDIIGKSLTDRIIEGEQILKDRLTDENNLTLACNVPDGKRAVSVNINEQIAVSDLIRPGDYVDVLVSFEKEDFEVITAKGSVKFTKPRITKMILQNIQVLALDQDQIVPDQTVKDPPKTVALAVNAQEAEKLTYASEFGTVRLSLRQAGDKKETSTTGIIRDDLVPNRNITLPTAN